MRAYEKAEIKNYKAIVDNSPEVQASIIDPTIVKNINEHTEYDVGFYCLFSSEDMKRAFKHHCFGQYTDA